MQLMRMIRTCMQLMRMIRTCMDLMRIIWTYMQLMRLITACMQERKAVKFFIDKEAFMTEQRLFSLDSLKALAPVFVANSDGAIRSQHGYVFPPHTVADAGQPLEKWMSSNSPDVITCVQVCCHSLLWPWRLQNNVTIAESITIDKGADRKRNEL
jgi:hypothetical protein